MDPTFIFVAIGITLVLLGLMRILLGYVSQSWPWAEAEILSTSIAASTVAPAGNSRGYVEAKVIYAYVVNGKRYIGKRISFGIKHNMRPEEARRELVEATRNRTVYYCPWMPSLAVLLPGFRIENFIITLVGFLFLLPLLR